MNVATARFISKLQGIVPNITSSKSKFLSGYVFYSDKKYLLLFRRTATILHCFCRILTTSSTE
uniref:Uncharacterized protein n=1 Tax=Octopus bimaculoides TaxID=37653 RepID=A0A0L8GJ28_OCTBM